MSDGQMVGDESMIIRYQFALHVGKGNGRL
jgi:hypothetical protein